MSVRIRVENFQSLRSVELDVEGLTVVTGSNNSGKSALVRAVVGVFQNTSGTSFVRHGADKCSVEVDFGDRSVKWEKGTGTRPTYVLDGGAPLYPGQSVPEEVAELGVRSVTAGGQETWPTIAPQFTGQTFLIDKPGSVLAESVADMERVGQLNTALRTADSDRRRAVSETKVRQSDLVRQEADVAGFLGLNAVVSLVDDLEKTREKLDRLRRAANKVASLRDGMVSAAAVVAKWSGADDVNVPVDVVTPTSEALAVLSGLRDRHVAAKRLVTRFESFAGTAIPSVDDVTTLSATLGVSRTVLTEWASVTRTVTACESEARVAESDLRDAEAEVVAALAELGRCPTCGTDTRIEGDVP